MLKEGSRWNVRLTDYKCGTNVKVTCGNYYYDETPKRWGVEISSWNFLSQVTLMFYSVAQWWNCELTDSKHISGIHFPWPFASFPCQQAPLVADTRTRYILFSTVAKSAVCKFTYFMVKQMGCNDSSNTPADWACVMQWPLQVTLTFLSPQNALPVKYGVYLSSFAFRSQNLTKGLH